MFIDALGWEIVNKYHFMEKTFPHRYPAKMQFGYSCTAIPTILTGQPPTKHQHLSFYYYNPTNSPFHFFKYLKFLPSSIFDRWRFRHLMSRLIKKMKGYTGYFELYAMPFGRLPYFDYIEKKDLFIPGGLSPVPNIADELEKRKIPYHISNWRLTEQQNIDAMKTALEKGEINFSFLYTAAMDGLLHQVTKDGKEIPEKLNWYEKQIAEILTVAEKNYDECKLFVMSDHGMTTLTEAIDVKKEVEKTNFQFGKDYAVVYDSTMARLWFFNDFARKEINQKLQQIPHSHLLSQKEKVKYKIDFPDNKFGETILLMDPGYQIAPSDMGLEALPGMHGFAPEHEDSFASFLSMEDLETPPKWVGNYFDVMVSKMEALKN